MQWSPDAMVLWLFDRFSAGFSCLCWRAKRTCVSWTYAVSLGVDEWHSKLGFMLFGSMRDDDKPPRFEWWRRFRKPPFKSKWPMHCFQGSATSSWFFPPSIATSSGSLHVDEVARRPWLNPVEISVMTVMILRWGHPKCISSDIAAVFCKM